MTTGALLRDTAAAQATAAGLSEAAPPAGGAADADEEIDVEVTVYIDRSMDLSSTMTFRSGTPCRAIKEQLAEADPTGMTSPDSFGLRLPGFDELLDDSMPIISFLREVDVCLPE